MVTATLNLNGVSNYSSTAVKNAISSILAPLGVSPSDVSVGAPAPSGSGPAPPAFATAPSTRRGLLASSGRALLQVSPPPPPPPPSPPSSSCGCTVAVHKLASKHPPAFAAVPSKVQRSPGFMCMASFCICSCLHTWRCKNNLCYGPPATLPPWFIIVSGKCDGLARVDMQEAVWRGSQASACSPAHMCLIAKGLHEAQTAS